MESMIDWTREFLKELERMLPPREGHHSFTYAQYGNDQSGWKDRLLLSVRRREGGVTNFFIDPEDLKGSAVETARFVGSQVAMQLGGY